MDPLSPRDIQARIRAGASPEVVAAETGWPLDKVERYAGPPLAERAYIAERAQGVEIRRTGGSVRLGEAVALVVGVDDARAIRWDALRRSDGRWIVTATLPKASGRSAASWTFDPAGPNVHPVDEPARFLMGVSDEPIIDFITEQVEVRPRLVAVPEIDEIDEIDEVVVESVDDTPAPRREEVRDTVAIQTTLLTPEPAPEPEKKAKRAKGRRASVPKWDEILFGSSKDD